MKHLHLPLGLVVLALLLLTGCGSAASASGSTASASPTGSAGKICPPLETVHQTLTQLSSIGDNTTIGEVKAAQQKLASALNAVAALPGSRGSAYDTIKSASDQLAAAVKDQPDSATVGQAGPRLQGFKSKMVQAQAAATKLATRFQCKV